MRHGLWAQTSHDDCQPGVRWQAHMGSTEVLRDIAAAQFDSWKADLQQQMDTMEHRLTCLEQAFAHTFISIITWRCIRAHAWCVWGIACRATPCIQAMRTPEGHRSNSPWLVVMLSHGRHATVPYMRLALLLSSGVGLPRRRPRTASTAVLAGRAASYTSRECAPPVSRGASPRLGAAPAHQQRAIAWGGILTFHRTAGQLFGTQRLWLCGVVRSMPSVFGFVCLGRAVTHLHCWPGSPGLARPNPISRVAFM